MTGAKTRIASGGLLLGDRPRASFAGASRLTLREPNLGTAIRIAAAINARSAKAPRGGGSGSDPLTLSADAQAGTPPQTIAAVFDALRAVGALTAEVTVR